MVFRYYENRNWICLLLKVDFIPLYIFVTFFSIVSKTSFRASHTSFWNHLKYWGISFFLVNTITITLFTEDNFGKYFHTNRLSMDLFHHIKYREILALSPNLYQHFCWHSHNVFFQLPGNTDGYSIERRKLKVPIDARYIRINPSKWKNGICMRVEFYGCSLSKFYCT